LSDAMIDMIELSLSSEAGLLRTQTRCFEACATYIADES
jgi:hypothetical protein